VTPRLSKRAVSFAAALLEEARVIFSKNPNLGMDYIDRLSVCSKCPHLSPKRMCKKCGCFVKFKARFKTAKCPIGLW
jgi:hypothetical protein